MKGRAEWNSVYGWGWSGGAMVLGKLSGAGASYLFGLE